MDQHVWISSLLADSELIIFLTADIAEENVDKAIEGLKLLSPGRPVPRELCPRRIWNDKDRKALTKLPDLSMVSGWPIISERAAAVFRQFDLGKGAIYSLEGAYQSDRVTRIAGDYSCWTFGNQKTAFLPHESPDKQPFGVQVNGEYVRWNLPIIKKDDQLAVSPAAFDGPDVWVDPLLFKSVFLSGALGDALDAAGLRKAFDLFRCRVA